MDVDPQPAAAAADAERDRLAHLMPDRVACQVAGEQDGDIRVDGGVPGTDGRPDLTAGLGRRDRSRGQPYTEGGKLGRGGGKFDLAGWRHRGHRFLTSRMFPNAGLHDKSCCKLQTETSVS